MLTSYLVPDKNKITTYKIKLEKENKLNPPPVVKADETKTE